MGLVSLSEPLIALIYVIDGDGIGVLVLVALV